MHTVIDCNAIQPTSFCEQVVSSSGGYTLLAIDVLYSFSIQSGLARTFNLESHSNPAPEAKHVQTFCVRSLKECMQSAGITQ